MKNFTIWKTYAGTAIIMAPEILKNEGENKEYDEKCDLWSIGVIIYELYFKRPPFNGNNETSILNLIRNQGEKLLKNTGCYQLDDLIEKLLIENPKKRISWDEYFNHSFFKDEIIITYKTDEKKEIKILGKQFERKNKNICYIYKCSSLLNIEDISNWNITNINDISYMFYGFSSLKSIPDISKWDISKVTNMSNE